MDKVYVLSHTDLDGYLSGGLVEYYYRRFIDKDAEFKHKSWTYGRNLPSVDYIKNNYDKVFIVDLCPEPTLFMFTLFEHFKDNFIWIDHHTKPDAEFEEKFKIAYPENFLCGLRADEDHCSSAALLTYKYFETKYNIEDPEYVNFVPSWLRYCSDFDCWNRYDDTIWTNRIMPIFSALKGEITNPTQAYNYIQKRFDTGFYYDKLHRTSGSCEFYNYQTDSEIKEGQILYKAIRAIYKAEAKHGFEREITVDMAGQTLTLKAWICNTQNRSSVIFEQMDNFADYDVFIPYHFNGEKYFYSMYTYKPEIKCNEICIYTDADNAAGLLRFNGHEDAAGSNSEKFAFPKS